MEVKQAGVSATQLTALVASVTKDVSSIRLTGSDRAQREREREGGRREREREPLIRLTQRCTDCCCLSLLPAERWLLSPDQCATTVDTDLRELFPYSRCNLHSRPSVALDFEDNSSGDCGQKTPCRDSGQILNVQSKLRIKRRRCRLDCFKRTQPQEDGEIERDAHLRSVEQCHGIQKEGICKHITAYQTRQLE